MRSKDSGAKCIHRTCEDDRAATDIDKVQDRKDLNGNLEMPVRVLWRKHGMIESMLNPLLSDWCGVAWDAQRKVLPGGHIGPHEAPARTVREIRRFLTRCPS